MNRITTQGYEKISKDLSSILQQMLDVQLQLNSEREREGVNNVPSDDLHKFILDKTMEVK